MIVTVCEIIQPTEFKKDFIMTYNKHVMTCKLFMSRGSAQKGIVYSFSNVKYSK